MIIPKPLKTTSWRTREKYQFPCQLVVRGSALQTKHREQLPVSSQFSPLASALSWSHSHCWGETPRLLCPFFWCLLERLQELPKLQLQLPLPWLRACLRVEPWEYVTHLQSTSALREAILRPVVPQQNSWKPKAILQCCIKKMPNPEFCASRSTLQKLRGNVDMFSWSKTEKNVHQKI